MILNTSKHHRVLLLSGTFLTLLLLISGIILINWQTGLIKSAAAADHTLNYTIDHSQLPQMNHYTLTYDIYVGNVSSVEMKNNADQVLPSTYTPATGIVSITTDETALNITMKDFVSADGNVGEITIAPLKDHRLWAWSHGFDDNVGFLKAVKEFEDFGMPATLYLNDYDATVKLGQNIPDPPDKPNPPDPYAACTNPPYECEMIVNPKLIELLEAGWAIGNHTENHVCWSVDDSDKPSDAVLWQDIVDVHVKLQNKIIAQSNRPNYIINSFAEPCFNNYHDLIKEKIQNNETSIIMHEGGFIDYSNPNIYAGATNIIPLEGGFDVTGEIVRDSRLENDSQFLQDMLTWLHQNSSQNNPITHWYNTISHDGSESTFTQAFAHLETIYGSNSAVYENVWLATAEEIFAYTYAKEKANIQLLCTSTIGDCTKSPITIPESVPGPLQIHGRIFNDLNLNGIDDAEPGIPDVRILYWQDLDCNGSIDEYKGEVVSLPSGSYTFNGLENSSSDCYIVQLDTSTIDGFTITNINIGPDNNDSDFYSNGFSEVISLPTDRVNAGLVPSSLITPSPTPPLLPSATPLPNTTPLPTIIPTVTPRPTQIPANTTQQQIFGNGEFNPNFITDFTWGTQFQIVNGHLRVTYINDDGGLFIRHWQEATSNVVALNFDVRSASFASRVLMSWVDENNIVLAENSQLLSICEGNYVLTQNIPEMARGFVLQEYSGERITAEHHTFDLDNISFLIQNEATSNEDVVFSIPECPIHTINLPLVVK
ncbi:MAG: SdrD B-like domain-containing protein [Anaerolineae bacterium]